MMGKADVETFGTTDTPMCLASIMSSPFFLSLVGLKPLIFLVRLSLMTRFFTVWRFCLPL